jgi:hypothetical protein
MSTAKRQGIWVWCQFGTRGSGNGVREVEDVYDEPVPAGSELGAPLLLDDMVFTVGVVLFEKAMGMRCGMRLKLENWWRDAS